MINKSELNLCNIFAFKILQVSFHLNSKNISIDRILTPNINRFHDIAKLKVFEKLDVSLLVVC